MRERQPERTDAEAAERTEEEAEETAREERLQRIAQRGYMRSLYPPQQAAVAFGRGGIELPRAVLDRIIGFQVDERRGFEMTLRQRVTLSAEHGSVTWAEHVRGVVTGDGIDRLEGVTLGDAPLGGLERTARGVEGVSQDGERTMLPGYLP